MKQSKQVLICVGAVSLLVSLPSHAGVALLSDDLYTGGGSHILYFAGGLPPGEPLEQIKPTTFTHGPFPQNSENKITFDSTGMHILADRVGSLFVVTHSLQVQGGSRSWTVSGFNVQFQVDSPEAVTLASAYVPDNAENVSLVDDTTSQLLYSGIDGAHFTGILQPGHYTYTGITLTDGTSGFPYGSSITAHITNATLSVTPEPTCTAILFIGVGLLGTRRRFKAAK